ncbi:MAG: MBL fold metallo-hydrolase [Treponemataceae bacterium]|nr:MBL fold metallo-hydrolase [Treponemataceae bacterium]
MIVTLTGTGTSHGIPVIGCDCPVCRSEDAHDKRNRCSAYIHTDNTAIVIDTGPEFRIQALEFKIKHLDAVLITHSHADHLNGLDDLRIFSHTASSDKKKATKNALNIYANNPTINDIYNRFDYIYKNTQQGGGKPLLNLKKAEDYSKEKPVLVTCHQEDLEASPDKLSRNSRQKELLCFPVPMKHGTLDVVGWNIREKGAAPEKSLSYLTDCSFIPEESITLVKGCEHLVIDGLRESPHSTHFSFAQALECAAKIQARHVWLTHICHNNSHEQIKKWISEHKGQYPSLKETPVSPAYDGLTFTI